MKKHGLSPLSTRKGKVKNERRGELQKRQENQDKIANGKESVSAAGKPRGPNADRVAKQHWARKKKCAPMGKEKGCGGLQTLLARLERVQLYARANNWGMHIGVGRGA